MMKRGMLGRERVPFQPETETPQSKCPRCGQWVDDHDGFGVLAHGACGYCSHPSSIDGICGICGDARGGDPLTTKLQKQDTVRYMGGLHTVVDTSLHDQFVKIEFNGTMKWLDRISVEFVRRTPVYEAFRKVK